MAGCAHLWYPALGIKSNVQEHGHDLHEHTCVLPAYQHTPIHTPCLTRCALACVGMLSATSGNPAASGSFSRLEVEAMCGGQVSAKAGVSKCVLNGHMEVGCGSPFQQVNA